LLKAKQPPRSSTLFSCRSVMGKTQEDPPVISIKEKHEKVASSRANNAPAKALPIISMCFDHRSKRPIGHP